MRGRGKGSRGAHAHAAQGTPTPMSPHLEPGKTEGAAAELGQDSRLARDAPEQVELYHLARRPGFGGPRLAAIRRWPCFGKHGTGAMLRTRGESQTFSPPPHPSTHANILFHHILLQTHTKGGVGGITNTPAAAVPHRNHKLRRQRQRQQQRGRGWWWWTRRTPPNQRHHRRLHHARGRGPWWQPPPRGSPSQPPALLQCPPAHPRSQRGGWGGKDGRQGQA